MNKNDLIRSVAKDTGISQQTVKTVLESISNILVSTLSNGEAVKPFTGVEFIPKFVASHKAVNPQNGEDIVVPDRYICNVKLSDTFKKMVNKEIA